MCAKSPPLFYTNVTLSASIKSLTAAAEPSKSGSFHFIALLRRIRKPSARAPKSAMFFRKMLENPLHADGPEDGTP